MDSFEDEGGEHVTSYDFTEEEKEHIRRLQALRETGCCNMFTEVNDGLHTVFGNEQANETYKWIKNNMEFYLSGKWKDLDV